MAEIAGLKSASGSLALRSSCRWISLSFLPALHLDGLLWGNWVALVSQICFQFLVCHLRLTLGSCHFVLKASGNSNSTSFLSCFEGSLSSHNMSWKREDCKYRDGFNPLLRLNPLSPRDGQSLSWHSGATHEHVSPIPSAPHGNQCQSAA